MLKRIIIPVVSLIFSVPMLANGWLPPSDDVVVEYFDVHVTFDSIHNKGVKLSQRDSVFQYIENKAVENTLDKLGRFAVWRMLPNNVIVPDSIEDKIGEVNIIVENAPVATLPDTVRTADGDVLLPYSIWARAVVSNANGGVLFEKDYGQLNGKVPLSKIKKDGRIKQASAIVGINEAVQMVRDDVYAKYGFDMCKDEDICQVPQSSKYYTFLKIVNGDMERFVDLYAYNDLLCQVYELNFPYSFIPFDTVNAAISSMEGTVISGGVIRGDYVVGFENGRFKTFSGNVYTTDEKGKPQKLKINKLTRKDDKKTGRYEEITTADGQFTRVIFPGYDMVTEWGVKSKQPNICKTENLIGSFIKLKEETTEAIEVTLDLYGKAFIDGESNSSKPFGLFKLLADSNSVRFPAITSENHATFHHEVTFDQQLHMVERVWTGSVMLEKDKDYNNYSYIKLDNCYNLVKVTKFDSHGNPVHFERVASGVLSNNWNKGDKFKIFDAFAQGKSVVQFNPGKEKNTFDIQYTGSGDVGIQYDENDEIAIYRIGAVQIVKKVNY